MDRVTGAYRRKTQFAVVVVAVVLVGLLGVDTFKVLSRLYVDDQVRFALAASVATNSASPPPAVASSDTPPLTYDQQLNLLSALDDPRFLGSIVSGPVGLSQDDRDAESRPMAEAIHVAGIIITIVVVSLGAPFWFDIFQLFMNARLAGPKPQTTSNGTKPASS